MFRDAIMSVPVATFLAYAPIVARKLILAKYGEADNTKPREEPTVKSDVRDTSNKSERKQGIPEHIYEIVTRLKSCHYNQLEMLGLYAGGIAVAVAVRVQPETLSRLSSWYIKSRLAYTLAYAAPQIAGGALRSATFFAAAGSCIMIYYAAADASASLLA